jgi:hypothetical protein
MFISFNTLEEEGGLQHGHFLKNIICPNLVKSKNNTIFVQLAENMSFQRDHKYLKFGDMRSYLKFAYWPVRETRSGDWLFFEWVWITEIYRVVKKKEAKWCRVDVEAVKPYKDNTNA